jgi:hypothetical protein
MLHSPDAETADDVRRLEDLGVTDLQIAPWNLAGIQAELGVSAMRMQPPLAVKQESLRRYAQNVIAKVNG